MEAKEKKKNEEKEWMQEMVLTHSVIFFFLIGDLIWPGP
jgi:hypothetical protein